MRASHACCWPAVTAPFTNITPGLHRSSSRCPSQSLHTDEDITSSKTVTPAEQKLGAHLSLLVKSWQDVLPLAQQLVHPSVKPRHLRTLLSWLQALHAGAAAGHVGAPATPPAGAAAAATAATTAAAAAAAAPQFQVPFVVPLQHVREDEDAVAEEAGRTSLAQLLSACSESQHTRELVARIAQVRSATFDHPCRFTQINKYDSIFAHPRVHP